MQSLSQNGTAKPAGPYDGFEIGSVIRVWWFYRRFIITIMVFISLATIVAVAHQQKLFTSVALIRLHYAPKDIVTTSAVGGQDQRDNPVIANSIVFMSSPSFLNMVAEKEDLYGDPEFRPEEIASLSEKMGGQGLDEEQIIKSAVIDTLAKRLFVAQRGGSHVISIEATSADPKKAARLANTAVEIFTKTELSRLENLEKKSLDWLANTIKSLKGEIASLEGTALELESKHGLHGLRDDSFITQETSVQLTELTTQLASIKAERATIKARYDNARSWTGNHGVEASLAIAKSPALDKLRNQETILTSQLSDLKQDLGENHPIIINIRNNVQSIRDSMFSEAHAIQERIKGDLIISDARELKIKKQLEILNKKTVIQQKTRSNISEIDKSIQIRQKRLSELAKSQIHIKEHQMIRQGLSAVMSPANIPTEHNYPTVWPLIAYTSFGGMSLCLVGIFFRDRWVSDFGFTSQEDLRTLSMNPMGIVPELTSSLSKETTVEDYIVAQPHSVHAEAIQRVRNHLAKFRLEASPSATVVSIASSSPKEGKTAMAVALARQTALSGSKVLFIDADVRNPIAPTLLGVEAGAGLCELLMNDSPSQPQIEQDPLTSLHILPAGRWAGSKADLFHSERMTGLLDEIRKHYDWIFFDSPSIGAVVDGVVLAKHADVVVYVARWLETTRNVVQMGINELNDAGITCTGVALTRVDMNAYQKYEQMEELRYYGYSPAGTSRDLHATG